MKRFVGHMLLLILLLLSSSFFLCGVCGAESRQKEFRPSAEQGKPDGPASGQDSQTGREEIPEWKARWELARLLSYVKRYDESIAQYLKLLRQKPDLLEAKIEMATVYQWMGQSDKAFEIFTQIPPHMMDENAKVLLAELHVARKEYDKAEAIYRSHVEKHPEDLRTRLKLAELLSWSKRYKESLDQYEVILKARPDDIQVRRKYALVLSWSGRHADAIAELRRTLD